MKTLVYILVIVASQKCFKECAIISSEQMLQQDKKNQSRIANFQIDFEMFRFAQRSFLPTDIS